MTEWLADRTLAHLRDVAEWPDLGDRYRITGRLGRGGMSTVFEAHDERLDREVAIKVLDVDGSRRESGVGPPPLARNQASSGEVSPKGMGQAAKAESRESSDRNTLGARLVREAHILARLEHPGIVPVHDAGVLPDGRFFYAMKLVRGQRLDQLISGIGPPALASDRASSGEVSPKRPWTAAKADSPVDPLAMVGRVCDAVSFAHAHGIVHGDLKPENIMVGPFGEVLVMDWGVATVVTGGATSGQRVVAGTPGFMAPEQAAGAAVDLRADVFGIGALIQAVMPQPMPRPLAAIAKHAMAANPSERYQSATAIAADLTRYRRGERVEAYPESLLERCARLIKRYRVPIGLLLAYMLMRVLLILWLGR